MEKIKFGLKLWSSDSSLIDEAASLIDRGIFDYIELIINPSYFDIIPFMEFDAPYIIHAPHENYGVDIGDKVKKDFTLRMIKQSLECADKLKADYVVLHAGTGSISHAKEVLHEVEDQRIIIENMPVIGIYGGKCLGYDAHSLLALKEDQNVGLCLDFGHAVKAAISLSRDFKNIVSEFLELEPKLFHLSDGDLRTEIDDHLNIGEGSYDLGYFKKCVEQNKFKFITLETPKSHTSLEDYVKNLKTLKRLWKL